MNCDINIVNYKRNNTNSSVILSGADKKKTHFDGFMKCLKLPNKQTCDTCNYKKKCFRQCGKCNNKLCIYCFENNNDKHINSCPYCRYTMSDHCYENNIVLN